MKRQYECLFIIDNGTTEDGRKVLIEKFQKMAGADCKVEQWGLRKFATEINHKKDGYYVLFNFSAEGDVPAKMGELMRITDGIVRFMFVNKDEAIKQGAKAKKEKKSE